MGRSVKFQAMRLYLVEKLPFFANGIYLLQYRPMPKEWKSWAPGPICIDENLNLYIDEEALEEWTIPQGGSLVLHEFSHFLREHSDRAKRINAHRAYLIDPEGRIVGLWNLAADAEINDNIEEHGFDFPFDVFLPRTMREEMGIQEASDHLLAEQYYRMLEKFYSDKGKSGGDSGEGDWRITHEYYGEQDPNEQGSSPSNSESGQVVNASPDAPPPHSKTPPRLGYGDCGSIADGIKRPWEVDGNDPDNVSPTQADMMRTKIAEDIRSYKGRGNVPGHWERWADRILDSRIDWRSQLSNETRICIARIAGKFDYSYMHPSRRRQGKIIYPRMVQPVVNWAVNIDTSGSMNKDDLGEALGDVKGILKVLEHRSSLQVFSGDMGIKTAQKVYKETDVQLAGGGGTDMAASIDWIYRNAKPRPELLITITDGWTPWPDKPPLGMKCIAVIVGNYRRTEDVPPWMRVIETPTDEPPDY